MRLVGISRISPDNDGRKNGGRMPPAGKEIRAETRASQMAYRVGSRSRLLSDEGGRLEAVVAD
jgi:hypothetical protein